jgi:DNA integrity scanning protein DisA with diadenylate cyclase activity
VDTVREEIRFRLPKLVANLVLALFFWVTSYVASVTLTRFSSEAGFLSQLGLLLAAGLFLVRTLFDALTIVDKVTKSFLKRFGITEERSRQRVLKDIIYIIVILLVVAAIFPIFIELSEFSSLLQQITTYVALGLILLFVYDIGRTFYRITEKTANSVANRISNPNNTEGD